jgi:hypothetical protein
MGNVPPGAEKYVERRDERTCRCQCSDPARPLRPKP